MVSLIDTDVMIYRFAWYAKSDGLRTFDSLIAATAIEQNCPLVSRNRKHFAMIEGLRLEAPQY